MDSGVALATIGGDFMDEFMIEQKTDVLTRKNSVGVEVKMKTLNPTNDFSFKGGGNPAVTIGVGTVAITGYTSGQKCIGSFKFTEKNAEYSDHDGSGRHLPSAA